MGSSPNSTGASFRSELVTQPLHRADGLQPASPSGVLRSRRTLGPLEAPEFVEPTARARRNLVALYVAAVVFGGLLVLFVRPALIAFISGLPTCEQARWSLAVLAVCSLPLPIVAAWTAAHARKLLKFDRSPPPGAWVWRRTQVRRGRAVRVQAYALITSSVVLLLAPLYAWHVLQPFVSALQGRCGT